MSSLMAVDMDGRIEDLKTWLGEGAAAVLFVHELTRNTAPIIRQMDMHAGTLYPLGFRGRIVFLTGDRTAGLDQLRRVSGSLQPSIPFTIAADGLEGPGEYALNRDCSLTLVLFRGGAVVGSYGMTDVGPQDFPLLEKWLSEVSVEFPRRTDAYAEAVERAYEAAADPDGKRELLRIQSRVLASLRRQVEAGEAGGYRMRRREGGEMERDRDRGEMRRPEPAGGGRERPSGAERPERPGDSARPERQGRPPEDPELNQLLRSYIRKTNDEAATDRLMESIRARASESPELMEEAIQMFRLMLSFPDRYGTEHAQEQAQEFLNTNSK